MRSLPSLLLLLLSPSGGGGGGSRGCLTGNDIVITRRDRPRARGAYWLTEPNQPPRFSERRQRRRREGGCAPFSRRRYAPPPLALALAADISRQRIIASVRLAADEYIIRDVFRWRGFPRASERD